MPDFDRVLPEDWKSFSWKTDLFYAKKVINVFDESALEIALSLCEEKNKAEPESASCTALTLAPSLPNSVRKNLYGLGFRSVVLLKSEYAEFAHEQTAHELCRFLEGRDFDLILTGLESGYGDTGLVPDLIASKMNIPMISNAESLDFEGAKLCVVHQGDFGKMQTELSLPALVSVGNSPLALRAATLRQQLMAGKKELEEVETGADNLNFIEPLLFTESHEKNCQFFEGEDMAEAAALLFDNLFKGEKQ